MTKLEKYKRLQKCPSWFQSSSSQGSSVWRNFQIKSEKKMQRIFLETDPAIALSRSRFLSATKTNIQAENNTEVQQRQLPAGLCPSIRQIAHVFALHFLFCPHHLFFFSSFFPTGGGVVRQQCVQCDCSMCQGVSAFDVIQALTFPCC